MIIPMTAFTGLQALQEARILGLDRLDAQLLLLHVLGKSPHDRAWLVAHDGDALAQDLIEVFQQFCQRRAAGEPLAYIVGHKEFFGLHLQVDARVLVPRPDTETLVEWALQIAQTHQTNLPLHILDLGTGSGAVALAVAHDLKTRGQLASIVAVDASSDALLVACENARQLDLDVQFIQSNWFDEVIGLHHVIVSNPPYISNADPHLSALGYEPLDALTSGADGLDDLRLIIEQAPNHLQSKGWLLLEHGYDQAEKVCALLLQNGFSQVQSRFDLAGIARCSGGQWPG